jgi:hypothetical protein
LRQKEKAKKQVPKEKPGATELQRQAGQLRKAPVKNTGEKAKELKNKRQESSPLLSEIEKGKPLRKSLDPEKARKEKAKEEKTGLGVSQKSLEKQFGKMTRRTDEQAIYEEQEAVDSSEWDD